VEHGTEILWHSPSNPAVWYAPSTLLWYGVLLIGPLVVALALKPLLYLALNALAAKANSGKPQDYDAKRIHAAIACRGYRLTILSFIYALAFGNACGIAVMKLGVPNPQGNAITVNTNSGLPAAAAFLAIPAIALFVASLVTLSVAPYYGRVLAESGLLSVIWLFAGAGGCLFAAVFSAIAGARVAITWVIIGLVLLAVGFWRRQARGAAGLSTVERARQEEQAAERAQAHEAAGSAPAEGQYHGPSPLLYWGRIGGMLAFPVVFFAGATALLAGSMGQAILRDPIFWAFALGAGCLFALLTWLSIMSLARVVKWDDYGVEVQWYRGDVRRFAWDQLLSLKVREVERGDSGAVVKTASGEKFVIRSGYRGGPELIQALEAHVWARCE
jgi:hypothetical protein